MIGLPVTTATDKDAYTAVVAVEVYSPNVEMYEACEPKARIETAIELEFRGYGIKSINLAGVGKIKLALQVMDSDDQFEVEVDCSKLKIETVPGNGVYASDLTLWLTQSRAVDYRRSSLTFVCFGKE